MYLHLGSYSTSEGVLDPLYKLQKRIIRIITKSPYKAHTTPLFKKLNMLKINDICKLEIAKKMFCLNINPDQRLTQNIKGINETHHYNTRHSSKQNDFLPRKRTEASKKSISFIGSKIWGEIPTQIKKLSYSALKKRLRLFFIGL